MNSGDWVVVEAYGGPLNRRVVTVRNGVVYVCKNEKFRSAREENREPVSIGFRLPLVLEAREAQNGD